MEHTNYHVQGAPRIQSTDFSAETLQVRRKWMILLGKNWQTEMYFGFGRLSLEFYIRRKSEGVRLLIKLLTRNVKGLFGEEEMATDWN